MKKEVLIKRIALLIVLIVIVALIVAFFVTRNKNNEEQLNEQEILQIEKNGASKEYNGIKFLNLKMEDTEDSETCNLIITIKNESENQIEEQMLDLVFLNENSEEVQRFAIMVPTLDAGVETEVTAIVSKELKNSYDYKIEKSTQPVGEEVVEGEETTETTE